MNGVRPSEALDAGSACPVEISPLTISPETRLDGLEQQSLALAIPGIRIGTIREQELYNFPIPLGGCEVQGRVTVHVGPIHVDLVGVQEQLHDRNIPALRQDGAEFGHDLGLHWAGCHFLQEGF
ncbi:hypothetical protein PENDEC_c030G01550 [Penicillium decumbens]|uniref:Uncharacterized protein n=1 Tax=Penicillium decumbens TaxID=69771 RepID=A0A1V6NVU8_PENDC|nr:hypothetical protein PENDEC_c030G01550 [Penicillium decumbens]